MGIGGADQQFMWERGGKAVGNDRASTREGDDGAEPRQNSILGVYGAKILPTASFSATVFMYRRFLGPQVAFASARLKPSNVGFMSADPVWPRLKEGKIFQTSQRSNAVASHVPYAG